MGKPLDPVDALPMKIVFKRREPPRRVYYGAAWELKKEIPI
jgi:hypothetical protein